MIKNESKTNDAILKILYSDTLSGFLPKPPKERVNSLSLLKEQMERQNSHLMSICMTQNEQIEKLSKTVEKLSGKRKCSTGSVDEDHPNKKIHVLQPLSSNPPTETHI